jgi:hypothetical protein
VAQTVNSVLVALYWHIGCRIREDILHEQRAEYGKRIVSTLSRQLASEYGSGYSRPNLFRMVRLAEAFPDKDIVSTLSKELSWLLLRNNLSIAIICLHRFQGGGEGHGRHSAKANPSVLLSSMPVT